MAERTIKLTGDLEAFVDAQIESGAYATPEDVVRAGFAALKGGEEQEEVYSASGKRLSTEELKAMIDEGLADEKAGRLHYYDRPGQLAEDVIRRGRRRLQRKRRLAAAKG
jgi:putative addiction module CopG family antidote